MEVTTMPPAAGREMGRTDWRERWKGEGSFLRRRSARQQSDALRMKVHLDAGTSAYYSTVDHNDGLEGDATRLTTWRGSSVMPHNSILKSHCVGILLPQRNADPSELHPYNQ